MSDDGRLGLTVTHRRYVAQADARYAGDLVAGAYVLELFGDVVTELSIRSDSDEGLCAGYDDVQFLAPVHAGDVIEITGTLTRIGRRSRTVELTAQVVCRAAPERSPSAADVLPDPVLVTRARGTLVVPG